MRIDAHVHTRPVCTVAGGYDAVVGIALDRVRGLSPAEQVRILGGTATDFYAWSRAPIE